jgi:hypothetical protein
MVSSGIKAFGKMSWGEKVIAADCTALSKNFPKIGGRVNPIKTLGL